jgi:hypothetical protein
MQNNVGIYASQISGHLWAPAGAYDALATVTPSGTGIVTFAGIPSGYKHLQIRTLMRNTGGGSGEQSVLITMNGDTGGNYATHRLTGNGSAAGAQSYTSGTAIVPYFNPENGTTSNVYGVYVIDLLDYANTSKNKTLRLLGGIDYNGSGTVGLISGAWFNTNAISSITFTSGGGNWTTESQFALYGIR